jgi:N-acetyl-1-D-myo-inositol-2-amino-2-deoxy-alpha-D-glucopyranoside deacetylase
VTAPAGDLAGHSLVGVFAHPDDECLACGGIFAQCAARGARVSLICATHGENRSGVRDQHFFEQRPRELAEAARILGIADVIQYDYADGFLPWIDRPAFRSRLALDLELLNAEVVVTFGQDGLYWHPDHIALHQMTTRTIEELGPGAPALFYVTMPPGWMRSVVDEFLPVPPAPGERIQLLGMANPDAFGVSCEKPTLVDDITSSARQKLAALQCHHTQLAGGVLATLRPEDAERVFRVEHFHRASAGSPAAVFIELLAPEQETSRTR